MSRRARRRTWEDIVAHALLDPDPVAALERASEDETLSPGLRKVFGAAAAQPHGVRMTALLVAKLRFERLIRGSPSAEAWFDRAPDEFASAFRRYHAEVRPSAFFPRAEGAAFEEWVSAGGKP